MENRKQGGTRQEFLRGAAQIPGIYVPQFYEELYHEDGTISGRRKLYEELPDRVRKEIVTDVSDTYYPLKPVVPFIKVTQDRVVLEIQRGASGAAVSVRRGRSTGRCGSGMRKC